MLDPERFDELEKIADKASEQVAQLEIPVYQLESIAWDEETYSWLIKFYTECGNDEYIGVFIGHGLDGNYKVERYFTE